MYWQQRQRDWAVASLAVALYVFCLLLASTAVSAMHASGEVMGSHLRGPASNSKKYGTRRTKISYHP